MYKLSPTMLNLYLECPRCFWLLKIKGIKRPEQPSSTLPRGMDYTLKNHYDYHRKDGLPPELKGLINGRLVQDEDKIAEIRKIGFGFQLNDEIWFSGALDDAVELPDGSIVPLDNKSRGFPPNEPHWTHKAQMSGYSLILREKGFRVKNLAYLIYWFLDHKNMDNHEPLKFNVAVEEVETDHDNIKNKILEAVEVLKAKMPEPGWNSGPEGNEQCHFCKYKDFNF